MPVTNFMPRRPPGVLRVVLPALLAIVLGAITLGNPALPAKANHGAGMDAMWPDMSPSGNTTTAIGDRQDCVQLAPGAAVLVDIVARKVPAANTMTGYRYKLNYSSAALTVLTQNPNFMLAANAGSSLFNLSEPLPDDDLDNDWDASLLDTGPAGPESGSGVLDRLAIQVDAGAQSGLYPLTLTNNGHLGADSLLVTPDLTYAGSIAVGVPCDTDGDGWNDVTEPIIGTSSLQNCGAGGWPAELKSTSPNSSTLNISDLASFVAPVRHLNTSRGEAGYDVRWDIIPLSSFGKDINISDLSSLVSGVTGYPPMFGGTKAYGQSCTVPPPPTPTPSPTPEPTPTPSPTLAPLPICTATPTPSPAPTDTPTPSPSPSPTPTETPSPTPTASPSPTPC